MFYQCLVVEKGFLGNERAAMLCTYVKNAQKKKQKKKQHKTNGTALFAVCSFAMKTKSRYAFSS